MMQSGGEDITGWLFARGMESIMRMEQPTEEELEAINYELKSMGIEVTRHDTSPVDTTKAPF